MTDPKTLAEQVVREHFIRLHTIKDEDDWQRFRAYLLPQNSEIAQEAIEACNKEWRERVSELEAQVAGLMRRDLEPRTFEIKPLRDKDWYWTVNIWPNKEGMQRAAMAKGDFVAICQQQDRFTNGKQETNSLGVIQFYEDKCGGGVVAHEMTHAAFFTLQKLGYDKLGFGSEGVSELEEYCCKIVGDLVNQFYTQFYEPQS